MARLTDRLGEWLSRVEILARGAEGRRLDAVRALDAARPWEARAHALSLLDEVPSSRVALALWADAAERMFLDHEVCEALERLVALIPFRADAWFRLALARSRLGQDPRPTLASAVGAREPAAFADAARMWLCDLDLLTGDAVRAERWLEQLSLAGRQGADAVLRRVETALDRGEVERARSLARELPVPGILDARGWLIRARLQAEGEEDPSAAFLRALVLDAPNAERAVAGYLTRGHDPERRKKLGQLMQSLGRDSHPLWRAEFALAEGRKDDALNALAQAAKSDVVYIERYLALALQARSKGDLLDAVALSKAAERRVDRGVLALSDALALEDRSACLSVLDAAVGPAFAWAESLRDETFHALLHANPVDFPAILVEVSALGRELGELDALRDAESVARDLERPLRVAIVGEFNAGKSTLINALLADDVAPTGILPTTATINHLVWAPDRFVRIERRDGGDDRVVPHQKLAAAIDEIGPAEVRRVTIYAPLELLRKIELVDTPGFNSPDPRHAEAARAAFKDAHVVLWLLDATQPLKASEKTELDGIRTLNLPLVVLVNKIDRLPNDEALVEALAHVERGLRDAGLVTEAPVVSLSARLARGNDPRSRWNEVEALVENVLTARSAVLRERALVGRLEHVARRLVTVAEARDAGHRERAQADAERRERWRSRALELRERRSDRIRELERVTAELAEELGREIAPVAGMLDDPSARRFVAERARLTVGRPLARRALELATLGDEAEALAELAPRLESAAAAVGARFLEAERRAELERDLAELVWEEVTAVLGSGGVNPLTLPPLLSPRAESLARALGNRLNGEAPGRVLQ